MHKHTHTDGWRVESGEWRVEGAVEGLEREGDGEEEEEGEGEESLASCGSLSSLPPLVYLLIAPPLFDD